MTMAVVAEKRPAIYEGSRIPQPIPTVLLVDPKLREEGDILEVNFGPNHPSTHGVLRLVVELNGERVVGLKAIVGYLHTGFEKNMEQKSWWKAITRSCSRWSRRGRPRGCACSSASSAASTPI